MTAFSATFGFILGAVVGSFLTCVTYRIPRRMPITGRSMCPNCGAQLKNGWNIPLFGWVLLRGRSGCCGQPISVRYPLIELAAGLVGLAIGVTTNVFVALGAVWVVVIAAVVLSAVTRNRPAKAEAPSPERRHIIVDTPDKE